MKELDDLLNEPNPQVAVPVDIENDPRFNNPPPAMPPAPEPKRGVMEAGLDGFNKILATPAEKLVSYIGGETDAVQQVMARNEEDRAKSKADQPLAYGVGETAGAIAGTLPLAPIGGSALGLGNVAGKAAQIGAKVATYGTQMGAQGAIAGGLYGDKDESVLENAAEGAAIMIAAGAALGGAYLTGKGLGAVLNGARIALSRPETLAADAINKTIATMGKDFVNATPKQFFDITKASFEKAKGIKDTLYQTRDDIADRLGIFVSHNGDDLSFSQAKQQLSGLNKSLSSTKAGSPRYFDLQDKVADLSKSIDDSLKKSYDLEGFQSLKKASDEADLYFKETFNPIQQTGIGKTLNTKRKISGTEANEAVVKAANDAIDVQFLTNFVKGVAKSDPNYVNAFTHMPEKNIEMLGTFLLKDTLSEATVGGTFNPTKWQTAITGLMEKQPAMFNSIKGAMNNLKGINEVAGSLIQANKAVNVHGAAGALDLAAVAGGTAFAFMANPGIGMSVAAVSAIPRTAHLYAAGKLMSNPAAQALLKTRHQMGETASGVVKEVLDKQIANKYLNLIKQYTTGWENFTKTASRTGAGLGS